MSDRAMRRSFASSAASGGHWCSPISGHWVLGSTVDQPKKKNTECLGFDGLFASFQTMRGDNYALAIVSECFLYANLPRNL